MEFNDYLEKCKYNDVIGHQNNYENEILFKVGELKKAITTAFKDAIPQKLKEELERQKLHIRPRRKINDGRKIPSYTEYNPAWFEEGVDFQILRAGSQGWEKGKMKIKVTLEFCLDEPEKVESESPLDDIRKTLNQ
ncbi:MAG: KGK domain-containing protein [Xenococcaceae cyanobacterium MO_188.B32]|nr:KGK domain-containing protein [Xenococcaceae cyanobacterium MO_188.B32]